jgi:PTH1 family peptidyl-tRNA hydrolase
LKTILAIGNPGDRYRDTRHNVAWWLADRLRAVWSFPPFRPATLATRTEGVGEAGTVRIFKPLTYVNRSGRLLAALLEEGDLDPVSDLLVMVDDVWLSPGEFRFRRRGSPGGHNGLESIERAVGSREYGRLRIGVGQPRDERIDLADEEAVIAAFDDMVQGVDCWAIEGIAVAMDRFNRRGKREG